MSKNIKLKTSREFLKNYFPENIRPWKKVSKKEKRILREKFFFLKRIKKRMNNLDETFSKNRKEIKIRGFTPKSSKYLKDIGVLNKKIYPRFLLSMDQLKNDFLQIQTQTKSSSEYLLKIKEKKKFSLLYGKVAKKFFQKVFSQAQRERGNVSNNLISLFETRLDVILYRVFFAKTISSAKQMINHNSILVNGVKMNISSYLVKPGDVIAVDQEKKIYIANLILNNLKKKAKIRRFRFLLSNKFLERKIRKILPQVQNSLEKKQKITLKIQKEYGVLQKIINKLKKQLTRIKKRNFKDFRKRKWSLETLVRFNNLKKMWKMYLFKLENTPYNLTKKKKQKFLYLQLKRSMVRKLPRYHVLTNMRISPMKPLHLEVSYKLLNIIFLYYPQKVVYPGTINLDLLSRSII